MSGGGTDPREQDWLEWLREKNGPRPDEPPPPPPPSAEPATREVGYFVGRLVRRRFLTGVGEICAAHGVDWKWDLERDLLIRRLVLRLDGPGLAVEATVTDIDDLATRVSIVGGG